MLEDDIEHRKRATGEARDETDLAPVVAPPQSSGSQPLADTDQTEHPPPSPSPSTSSSTKRAKFLLTSHLAGDEVLTTFVKDGLGLVSWNQNLVLITTAPHAFQTGKPYLQDERIRCRSTGVCDGSQWWCVELHSEDICYEKFELLTLSDNAAGFTYSATVFHCDSTGTPMGGSGRSIEVAKQVWRDQVEKSSVAGGRLGRFFRHRPQNADNLAGPTGPRPV